MEDHRNHIEEDLIIKSLAGEASPEEEKQLLIWIATHANNERRFVRLKKIFELSKTHYTTEAESIAHINVDQEWNHFVARVEQSKEKPTIALQQGGSGARTWLRIAATLLLLIASGLIIRYFVSRQSDVTFKTASNTRTISLPDGSRVTLNRNSALSYDPKFGQESRTLILKGEAFFEVAHDASKPFVIHINNAEVEVLGTSFDVQGYAQRKEVEVVVQTGVVMFSIPDEHKEVKLNAGQKGVYTTALKSLNSASNKDINFLSWSTQKINFSGEDLRTVIETLNKTYHANIILSGDVSTTCVVTVSFDHQTLEAVLHVLESTLNLTYQIKGNQIEITKAGC